MSRDARTVVEHLVGARNERSAQHVAALLDHGVRYWDCERGAIAGREAVSEALVESPASFELETLAAQDDDAVAEVLVAGVERPYRSTEVYHLKAGVIASIKAYFDPAARR